MFKFSLKTIGLFLKNDKNFPSSLDNKEIVQEDELDFSTE
jgi:hypothetical protein